ncbi:hypothetical protein HK105_205599 [Polyrhizophydium stewartii]|uniref:Uncharacterized protein n=1 Tax=Polyrhizophydium stewartii TaxID=2732419 RepID=A0ABR4N5N2_9FUNG|nr:hypothetical protein HK105_004177 [Polyrhizophydium stewartii]
MLAPDARSLVNGTVACIGLHMNDTIRLVSPPSLTPDVLRRAIAAGWPRGIDRETLEYGLHGFKLNGAPWSSSSYDSMSCALVLSIVRTLATQGWRFLAGVCSSKKLTAIDSLFFARAPPVAQPVLFGMFMYNSDSLRIVGDFATGHSEAIRTALRDAVVAAWPPGLQRETIEGGEYRVKLRSYPWGVMLSGDPNVRAVLSQVIHSFATIGFRVVGTCGTRYAVARSENGSHRIPTTDMWLFELDAASIEQLPSYADAHGDQGSSSAPALAPSIPPPLAPRQSGRQIVSLTALGGDSLEIVSPQHLVQPLVDIVSAHWSRGIQRLTPPQPLHRAVKAGKGLIDQTDVVTIIKMAGYPWSGSGDDAVKCRHLVLALLAHMRRRGWRLIATPEPCKNSFSVHPLFFEPGVPETSLEMFSVSLSGIKNIHLIHNDGDMSSVSIQAATEAINEATAAVPGSTEVSGTTPGMVEWTMTNVNWAPEGGTTAWNRVVVAGIIDGMLRAGFELYTASRLKSKGCQCDTLVFVRNVS